MPELRTSSVARKPDATLSSSHTENKSANFSDQKNLMVRIKVGSDNLLTPKNSELCNGIGLDVSPTSSLDVSPRDIKLSHEPLGYPDESPTSILEVHFSHLSLFLFSILCCVSL